MTALLKLNAERGREGYFCIKPMLAKVEWLFVMVSRLFENIVVGTPGLIYDNSCMFILDKT